MFQHGFLYVTNALYVQWDVSPEHTGEVKAKEARWPEKGLSPGADTFGVLHVPGLGRPFPSADQVNYL